MSLDFIAEQWLMLEEKACFNIEQQEIITLVKKHGKSWTQKRYAKELNMSLRTFERRWKAIKHKIFLCLK